MWSCRRPGAHTPESRSWAPIPERLPSILLGRPTARGALPCKLESGQALSSKALSEARKESLPACAHSPASSEFTVDFEFIDRGLRAAILLFSGFHRISGHGGRFGRAEPGNLTLSIAQPLQKERFLNLRAAHELGKLRGRYPEPVSRMSLLTAAQFFRCELQFLFRSTLQNAVLLRVTFSPSTPQIGVSSASIEGVISYGYVTILDSRFTESFSPVPKMVNLDPTPRQHFRCTLRRCRQCGHQEIVGVRNQPMATAACAFQSSTESLTRSLT